MEIDMDCLLNYLHGSQILAKAIKVKANWRRLLIKGAESKQRMSGYRYIGFQN